MEYRTHGQLYDVLQTHMQSRGCHLVQSQDIPHNLIG